VSLISVDFPDPETPVTHTSTPTGRSTVTFFRLFPVAPLIVSIRSGSGLFRRAGKGICRRPARYCPVSECGARRISSDLWRGRAAIADAGKKPAAPIVAI
jgi:hypothetical protein